MYCHFIWLGWLKIVFFLLFFLWPLSAYTEPRIIASIKPIYSLVAGVMYGVGEPTLLLHGGASPHEHSLRPSEIRIINEANVVFWVGPDLENFLIKPLNSAKTRSISLLETHGIEILHLREGGIWDQNAHHTNQSSRDTHIWLDPINAIVMVKRITSVLSEVDSSHRIIYERNGASLVARLGQLNKQLEVELTPIKDKAYIVFHDAYQYFERRYGLRGVGSIVLNPEQQPSVRRISEIQTLIHSLDVRCVFSEPQFQPALVDTIVASSGIHSGVLDPIGAGSPAGIEAYFTLLQGLVDGLLACLK